MTTTSRTTRTTSPRTTATTSTSGTARTTRTPGNAPAAAAGGAGGAVGSGAGRVRLPATPIVGMKNFTWSVSNLNPSAGQTNTNVSNVGVRQAGGSYSRGKIEVGAKAVDDKAFDLTVKTMHSNGNYGSLQGNDDKMTLMLQARVVDGAEEGIINLAVLKNNEALNNKGKYDGEHTFRINYEDVNKYLATLSPNLKLVAGARFAVAAKWESGHEWGGFGRKGDFEVPTPPQGMSPVATRVARTTTTAAAGKAASLPLDITYDMPASARKDAPAGIFGRKVEVSSRLETELKGLIGSEAENEGAILRLYQLANDPAALKSALGSGFTLSPHTEWWQQTPTGRYKKSTRMEKYRDPAAIQKAGIVKTKKEAEALAAALAGVQFGSPLPLEDKYSGDSVEMKASIIQRVRSNAIAEGVFNLKPGAGVLLADISAAAASKPSGLIRKRIEYGMTLQDKNVKRADLDNWLRTNTSPYNPAGEALRELMPQGPQGTKVEFKMVQERHRFTLEHKDGLSIDISVDFVEVKNPKTGKTELMQFVEMEIDHLYFGKGNKASAASPTSLSTFDSEKEQKDWSKTLTGGATLNGMPRFHQLADLKDKSIWKTKEQKETEKAIDALFPLLFPKGAKTSPQKGVAMAEKMRLI